MDFYLFNVGYLFNNIYKIDDMDTGKKELKESVKATIKGRFTDILLTILIAVVSYGGQRLITSMDNNTAALNEIKIELATTNASVDTNTKTNEKQDKAINANTKQGVNLEGRVIKLETIKGVNN